MLLACYTPYTFSSEIFGPIAPDWKNVSQARLKWLHDDIIEEIDPALKKKSKAMPLEDKKLDLLLGYFKCLYHATAYTHFTPREEHVLRAILMNTNMTLQDVKKLPAQKYPEHMSKEQWYRDLFIATYEPFL